MEISFKSNRLQKQLEDERRMNRAFGDRANRIRLRLSTLMSAQCLAEVPSDPPDRCHPLKGTRDGQFAVYISGNFRLVFELDHIDVPRLENGDLDLKSVTKICIIEVVDYHDE